VCFIIGLLQVFSKDIVNMDQMFIGKVILNFMVFSIILGNYIFHISQVTKNLYQNASSCFDVDPILFAMSNKRKKYSSCIFWIEPKQKTH